MPTKQRNSRCHLLLAIYMCWQLPACEKADQAPETLPEVLGVTTAAFLPETDFIAGCEFDAARPDRLRTMLADRIADQTSRCDFNPIDRLRSMVVGIDLDAETIVMAFRGIRRGELTKCLAKLGNQPVDEGPITRFAEADTAQGIGWLSSDVFIAVLNTDGAGEVQLDQRLLEERVGAATGLADDSPLLRMLEPRQGAQCTFASTPPAIMTDAFGAAFDGMTLAFGRLRHVDLVDQDEGLAFDEIDLNLTLRFATAAQGEAAARALPEQMTESVRDEAEAEALAILVDMVEITHAGTDVRLRLKVDRPASRRLAQVAGGRSTPK